MTTLYHFAAPVKPARYFGRGILRSLPTHRYDHTAADERWLAADDARRELDALLDDMAAEAEALARLEAGCLL